MGIRHAPNTTHNPHCTLPSPDPQPQTPLTLPQVVCVRGVERGGGSIVGQTVGQVEQQQGEPHGEDGGHQVGSHHGQLALRWMGRCRVDPQAWCAGRGASCTMQARVPLQLPLNDPSNCRAYEAHLAVQRVVNLQGAAAAVAAAG